MMTQTCLHVSSVFSCELLLPHTHPMCIYHATMPCAYISCHNHATIACMCQYKVILLSSHDWVGIWVLPWKRLTKWEAHLISHTVYYKQNSVVKEVSQVYSCPYVYKYIPMYSLLLSGLWMLTNWAKHLATFVFWVEEAGFTSWLLAVYTKVGSDLAQSWAD